MFVPFLGKAHTQMHINILRSWHITTICHLQTRWHGFPEGHSLLGYDQIKTPGKWVDDGYSNGKYTYKYQETEIERAWAKAMDRKYLTFLAQSNPHQFLEEMTPNPKHDGVSLGLDLKHPHHVNLQKEFQVKVREVCNDLGLTAHPAMLNQQQDLLTANGESKPSTQKQEPQQLVAVEKTVTQGTKEDQQQGCNVRRAHNPLSSWLRENGIWPNLACPMKHIKSQQRSAPVDVIFNEPFSP